MKKKKEIETTLADLKTLELIVQTGTISESEEVCLKISDTPEGSLSKECVSYSYYICVQYFMRIWNQKGDANYLKRSNRFINLIEVDFEAVEGFDVEYHTLAAQVKYELAKWVEDNSICTHLMTACMLIMMRGLMLDSQNESLRLLQAQINELWIVKRA